MLRRWVVGPAGRGTSAPGHHNRHSSNVVGSPEEANDGRWAGNVAEHGDVRRQHQAKRERQKQPQMGAQIPLAAAGANVFLNPCHGEVSAVRRVGVVARGGASVPRSAARRH